MSTQKSPSEESRLANSRQARLDRFDAKIQRCIEKANGDRLRFVELVDALTPYSDHSECDHDDGRQSRQRCLRTRLIEVGSRWGERS